ncbi:response regulator transcription factor [Neptunomonas concharum]|uniref:Response regulator transcription factor n=1 Tax=Neptunomonas concharum TaxID=1031538 RepID=A0A5P1REU8_9GAMM|nr:response regulator [Neptunomonas concharum]QEQ98143.1 response regulator transcription factor [Neptunomonas concharum]
MSTEANPTVFVVDDDADVRDSLQWLLESVGLCVQTFETGQAFLDAASAKARGCILMDVRMPGISGLTAQKQLSEQQISIPLIMISGHADVDMAVTAMTQGAKTFLQKPFSDQALIDHVQQALLIDEQRWQQQSQIHDLQAHYDSLTRRERQVFEGVVSGMSNQEIADHLSINRKTVEGHRSHMMAKMQASSLSELVQMSVRLGLMQPFS